MLIPKTQVFGIWFISLFVACSSHPGDPDVSRQLLFTPLKIANGCNGDVMLREKGYKILSDAASLDAELSGSLQSPTVGISSTVDFTQSVVVAAHMGVRPDCGGSVSISDVRETDSAIEVTITLSSGANCPSVDESISYPVAFAEIPKSVKPYTFLEARNDDCVPASSN
jgi:hypothetical protein